MQNFRDEYWMEWRILLWAAMHHHNFHQCRVYSPLFVKVQNDAIAIVLRIPSVLVPWQIREDFSCSTGVDITPDIPF